MTTSVQLSHRHKGIPEVNLAGKRFDRLTVIGMSSTRKYGKLSWDCKCDCGNTVIATTAELNCGDIRSCGCLQRLLKELGMDETVKRNDELRYERRRKIIMKYTEWMENETLCMRQMQVPLVCYHWSHL